MTVFFIFHLTAVNEPSNASSSNNSTPIIEDTQPKNETDENTTIILDIVDDMHKEIKNLDQENKNIAKDTQKIKDYVTKQFSMLDHHNTNVDNRISMLDKNITSNSNLINVMGEMITCFEKNYSPKTWTEDLVTNKIAASENKTINRLNNIDQHINKIDQHMSELKADINKKNSPLGNNANDRSTYVTKQYFDESVRDYYSTVMQLQKDKDNSNFFTCESTWEFVKSNKVTIIEHGIAIIGAFLYWKGLNPFSILPSFGGVPEMLSNFFGKNPTIILEDASQPVDPQNNNIPQNDQSNRQPSSNPN
jgi:hypothetical protein